MVGVFSVGLVSFCVGLFVGYQFRDEIRRRIYKSVSPKAKIVNLNVKATIVDVRDPLDIDLGNENE